MGNEQSSQLSHEQREAEEQQRAQIRAEIKTDLDRLKAEARERILEEQRQEELMQLDAAAVALSDAAARDVGAINAETSSTQVNGEHRPSTTMAIRSLEASQEEGEIVETPGPDYNSEEILRSFEPRKERREKDSPAFQPPAEEIDPGTTTRNTNKRAAPAQSAYADERRANLSDLPKIAKRTPIASPRSSARATSSSSKGDSASRQDRPPRWYEDLKEKNRDKSDSNADTILTSLREQINKAQTSGGNANVPQNILDSVRSKLHTLTFVAVNEHVLKRNRMLTNDVGLPRIFSERYSKGVNWPFDIRADAKELYNKWSRRTFGTDLMRGINFSVKGAGLAEGGQGSGDSVQPAYKISAKYHGNGDLLNGQWWPLQICALRDGAHGEMIAGISGEPGDGAYSIVMSGGHQYVDEDYGDVVKYCGTDSENGAITENTRKMLESVGNQPVRLIRSHKLDSPYAPNFGMRYDGLYDVISSRNIDGTNSLRQRHVFKLVRRKDQDPIRGGPDCDGRAIRPTEQEIQAYKEHRRFSGRE